MIHAPKLVAAVQISVAPPLLGTTDFPQGAPTEAEGTQRPRHSSPYPARPFAPVTGSSPLCCFTTFCERHWMFVSRYPELMMFF